MHIFGRESKGLSRIQLILLVSMILVMVVGGSFVYFFCSRSVQSTDTVKIGICGDLDNSYGKAVLRGAVLAAEQVNAEGGVLGRRFETVAEDDDSESLAMDFSVASNAMIRLITVDKADYIIAASGSTELISTYQDICGQHGKILFTTVAIGDKLTLRVLEDYDKYKYFFRAGFGNGTTAHNGRINSLVTLRNYTGFNKVAYLYNELGSGIEQLVSKLEESLLENGFEIVYGSLVPMNVIDFTSYLAVAEDSGAEILTTFVVGPGANALVRDWHDRQSPFVLWGVLGDMSMSNSWDVMEGKCEFVSMVGYPIISGYPLTSRTVSTRDAYIERWGEIPSSSSGIAYDVVKFILPDAIRRADTTEVESLIESLEQTDVETSSAPRFVFTSNHDIMVNEADQSDPGEDYVIGCFFQWQNGMQVPVYPKKIMKEAGASYIFPDWPGPWD